ncbi:uncharacterized protein TRIADDRAFT_64400 [Trichoplax adhaerens]|uniref:Catalase core domain-containing protein n=1 Tax=Trichoplax adhaerens TaxID=10228 RepID=B3SCK3_TRIAD|nr:hypothetical protein TRIADDRAFT_64400 [Trichoplax adhaerens]EDV19532.1 hypothetical protein TRIADDRAFT_64400 [Trichoplax adhaerens]|eukprot:XP_002117964.1 hypothetical protein TRIADDRAFT_64400 [Trichoplax adhaerens]
MSNSDKASQQLQDHAASQNSDILTNSGGDPVESLTNLQTVGPRGPALFQNITYLDNQAHFNRERIPERVAHAKGAGAFGYFEVTNDITKYCKAKTFTTKISYSPIDLKLNFCFAAGEKGSADTVRDAHGFAVRFYTVEGNWDLVGINSPVFLVRDAILTNQGVKNLSAQQAAALTGTDPDYAIRDLYNAIAAGNFPSWNMFIQVMTFEQAEAFQFNPFDVTKIWPHAEYPLIPVGKLVLNRNPTNYFAEVEQLGFSPANLVPGILPSPDKVLQGRLFAYSDTQRHRLGANATQIPVNCPYNTTVSNYQRDGPMTVINQG